MTVILKSHITVDVVKFKIKIKIKIKIKCAGPETLFPFLTVQIPFFMALFLLLISFEGWV